jgi:6-phosphogluconolactonase
MSDIEAPGERVVLPDASAVASQAAARIAAALQAATAGGPATLALSGGNTPRDAYSRLAHEAGVDWSRVRVLWVDERAVPPSDDRSNYRWAKATLLGAAPIPEANVHRMEAEREDLDAAAREYEQTVRACAGAGAGAVPVLDVVVLGVGDDGHTASLFPGETTVDIRDRVTVAVPAAARREARMTLTTPVLESARRVYVLAVGASKRDALRRAWSREGDLSATPSRLLRGCRGSLTWLIDAAARPD